MWRWRYRPVWVDIVLMAILALFIYAVVVALEPDVNPDPYYPSRIEPVNTLP